MVFAACYMYLVLHTSLYIHTYIICVCVCVSFVIITTYIHIMKPVEMS